jgi:hypothetical protein
MKKTFFGDERLSIPPLLSSPAVRPSRSQAHILAAHGKIMVGGDFLGEDGRDVVQCSRETQNPGESSCAADPV